MRDGAPPHISRCVKQLLCRHIGDERSISPQFPRTWIPRSSEFLRFLALGKCQVHGLLITSPSGLKENIERYVRNIPQFMLLSTV